MSAVRGRHLAPAGFGAFLVVVGLDRLAAAPVLARLVRSGYALEYRRGTEFSFTNDASLLLPQNTLGRSYLVVSRPNNGPPPDGGTMVDVEKRRRPAEAQQRVCGPLDRASQ